MTERVARVLPALASLWLLVALPVAAAQLQVATLHGTLRDAQALPIAGATLALLDASGATAASAMTNANGEFRIESVAPGAYTLRATAASLTLLTQRLVVRGGLPIELALTARTARVQDDVVVHGDASSNSTEQPWSVAGNTVRNLPSTLPSQRVPQALASLPGWMAEDNGLLHVRGVDDGLLYVQDGVPVYGRLDRLFGTAPTSAGIDAITVIDGYIPPEFGFKSGGVIQVRSASGLGTGWRGSLDAGAGADASRHVESFLAGPLRPSVGLMLSGSAERSDRFLDPVSPDNLHNSGRAFASSGQLTWRRGTRLVTATLQQGLSRYDVPHDEEQDDAGQDASQRVRHWMGSLAWQHVVSDRAIWQLSAYRRSSGAELFPSAFDTPVSIRSHRTDVREGAIGSLTYQAGRHTLKAGAEASGLRLDERFAFAVTDPEAGDEADLSDAALAYDALHPFLFQAHARPWLAGVFAQDSFAISPVLTLDYGFRADWSALLVRASQVSPRAGLAFRAGSSTTLRASVSRLFQPPQSEFLLLASSPEAQALSPFAGPGQDGGADLQPERQTAIEASVTQAIGANWQLEAAAWWRRGQDVDDPNVLFGSTITFPNSVAQQRAHGFDMRLDMRPWRGWQAQATYSYARIVQFGPINGGLFLEDTFLDVQDGTEFVPDHDQRHALVTSASYASADGRWRFGAAFRYRSGTPIEIEDDPIALSGRAGAEAVNGETGRVRPQIVTDLQTSWRVGTPRGVNATAVLWVDNLFDQFYAFNFGNPFSGTHFGAGRRAGMTIKLTK